MNNEFTALSGTIASSLENLKKDIPDAIKNFTNLSREALQNGAIDKRTKELIVLVIAIIQKSNECIGFHLQSLIKQGLTYDELLEIATICVYVGGGPALMTATSVLENYQNQTDKTENTNVSSNDQYQKNESNLQENFTKGYE